LSHLLCCCSFQQLRETVPEEDVVPQYQTNRVLADKFLSYYEGFCNTSGLFLFRVIDLYPKIATAPNRPLNPGRNSGIEITKISLIPASISADRG
jgi:hypothetical protein